MPFLHPGSFVRSFYIVHTGSIFLSKKGKCPQRVCSDVPNAELTFQFTRQSNIILFIKRTIEIYTRSEYFVNQRLELLNEKIYSFLKYGF